MLALGGDRNYSVMQGGVMFRSRPESSVKENSLQWTVSQMCFVAVPNDAFITVSDTTTLFSYPFRSTRK